MKIPTPDLSKAEKCIIYILLFVFLLIPIISLIKVSTRCLDAVDGHLNLNQIIKII